MSSSARNPTKLAVFVGDEACRGCHQEKATEYWGTAHHLTSCVATERSIAGNFSDGLNVLQTSNPSLYFRMSTTPDGHFQSAEDEISSGKTLELKERFDVVIGSGRKAQSYLFWKGDNLFELPVSYWTESHQWINSPGYPDGTLHFDRPIIPRCLECHASSFESLAPPPNRFNKDTLVLGISCEKCHGPGVEHVARYSSQTPPRRGAAKAIINPASLSRNRQIDVCALCHAGVGTSIAPPLSFVPGKEIDKYLTIPDPGSAPVPGGYPPVDVHGNQVELLKESKCFRSSSMTCTTCHDVHTPQRDAAAFSGRCLSCHQAQNCGEFARLGNKIANNCVDCHMPLQKSELLFSKSKGRKLAPLVRNHRIGIYADSRHSEN